MTYFLLDFGTILRFEMVLGSRSGVPGGAPDESQTVPDESRTVPDEPRTAPDVVRQAIPRSQGAPGTRFGMDFYSILTAPDSPGRSWTLPRTLPWTLPGAPRWAICFELYGWIGEFLLGVMAVH